MKRLKKNVLVKRVAKIVLLGIAFFPFLNTEKLFVTPQLYDIFRGISSIILTIAVLRNFKMNKITPLHIILLLFSVYELAISMKYGTLTAGIVFAMYYRIVSVFYIIKSFAKKDYTFIFVISCLLNILVLADFPSVLNALSVAEYDKTFLLGGKNSLALIVIPAIFFSQLYAYLSSKKYSIWQSLMLVVDLLTLLLCGSSTGLIIGVFMTMFALFGKRLNISFKFYVVLFILVLFAVFNITLIKDNTAINDFLAGSMNKDLTFSGRTNLWNMSLKYIVGNFWGYGRGNEVLLHLTGYLNETHNTFLEILLSDGIPGITLFVLYLINCIKGKLHTRKNKYINVCMFAFFSFMLLSVSESIACYVVLWWIMTIIFCLSNDTLEAKK